MVFVVVCLRIKEICLFNNTKIKEITEHIKHNSVVLGGEIKQDNIKQNDTLQATEISPYAGFPREADVKHLPFAITREMLERNDEQMKRNPVRPLWNSHAMSPIPPPIYIPSLNDMISTTIHQPNKKRFQKTRKIRK
jgi:hypothetical protein